MDRRQHADASPTERTLAEVRARGWYASSCEGWRPAGPRCVLCGTASFWRRSDLLGFADILALPAMIAIQTTSGKNHAARVTKILHECQEPAWHWLQGHGRIQVWSWRQAVKPLNGKHWLLRIDEITPEMLLDAGYAPPEIAPSLFSEEGEICPQHGHRSKSSGKGHRRT